MFDERPYRQYRRHDGLATLFLSILTASDTYCWSPSLLDSPASRIWLLGWPQIRASLAWIAAPGACERRRFRELTKTAICNDNASNGTVYSSPTYHRIGSFRCILPTKYIDPSPSKLPRFTSLRLFFSSFELIYTYVEVQVTPIRRVRNHSTRQMRAHCTGHHLAGPRRRIAILGSPRGQLSLGSFQPLCWRRAGRTILPRQRVLGAACKRGCRSLSICLLSWRASIFLLHDVLGLW